MTNVHRSPSFLGVKLKRWSGASKDIVIEDCEPEVLDIVVNYMHGIEMPDLVCSIKGVPLILDLSPRIAFGYAKFLTLPKGSSCQT